MQSGLTLLELLIALAIFSLISLMSYGGLKTVLDGREGGEKVADRLSEIEIAFTIFERDLLQIVKRPVRGNYGDAVSAFIAGSGQSKGLEFTRGGRPNPLKRHRSALQRVRYEWIANEWVRKSWSVLDRAEDSESQQQVLLTRIKSFSLRFLDGQQEWSTEWEIPLSTGEELTEIEKKQLNLPLAIELTMDIEGWGWMRRLLLLPPV